MKNFQLLRMSYFTKVLSVSIFLSLVLFTSCNDTRVGLDDSFNKVPDNGYEALSLTLQNVSNKIKSQEQAQNMLMAQMVRVNDPAIKQACNIVLQNSLLNKFFPSDSRARTTGNGMNVDAINQEINSSKISKHVRKNIADFGKKLEKIKDKALKNSIDEDKEILSEITALEKQVSNDQELNAQEKTMLLGITQVLKNSYKDIKQSAEQAVANGRTSCWLCWVVNAVVTVVVVAVVVGVVAIASLASFADENANYGAIALLGGGIGVIAGIVSVATGNCFVVIDYGQSSGGSTSLFGVIELSSC